MLILGWQDGQLVKVLTVPGTSYTLYESTDNILALPSQMLHLHPGPSNSTSLGKSFLGSSEVRDPFSAQGYCTTAPVCVFVDLVVAEDAREQARD